jgi:hypothetical protein
MTSIEIDPLAHKLANEVIFISGAARTGTTMLGKLFHSLSDVEYMYEPALLISLMAKIEDTPEDIWRLLYETYVFEDFLINALAGRNLNLNSNDDSSFLRAKTQAELESRTVRSMRHHTLFEKAATSKLVIKIPDVVHFMPLYKKYYPGVKIVALTRSFQSIIASLIKKGWFSDAGITGVTGYWPYKVSDNINLPFWLGSEFEHEFINGSEIQRCCIYLISIYENAINSSDFIFINYDNFIKDPKSEFSKLANSLEFKYGTLTEKLLSEVGETAGDRTISFDAVSDNLTQRLNDLELNLNSRANLV